MKAKKSLFAAFLFMLIFTDISAKESSENTTYYVTGISFVTSGSGQGSGISLYAGVGKGRKFMKAGIIFCNHDSKISGGDFEYRLFLGDFTVIQGRDQIISPFLQYNILYQKRISYSPDIISLGEQIYYIESDPGSVATMGHFASLGSTFRIMHRIFVEASLGLGLYIGSVDKVNGQDTCGIHCGNYGFTYTCKIGISYSFGSKRETVEVRAREN
jgi:hypothetical protein